MSSLKVNRRLTSLDEMFGNVTGMEEEKEVTSIAMEKLRPRKNHKFHINLGKKNEDLLQSIREFGVLEPIIVRPLENQEGIYEILAGHRRTAMAKEAGLEHMPVVIKKGLTEAEADLIETETNLLQRSWEDMKHSERAEVLYAHYTATSLKGVRKGFLEEIYALQSDENIGLANPVNSRTEDGLSPMATKGNIRTSGAAYALSKDTVARYLRIYTLDAGLKERVDTEEIPLRAGVHLSYLKKEHQKQVGKLLEKYKIDIKKAQELRRMENHNALTEAAIEDVLSGKEMKKQGRPKAFRIKNRIIQRFFPEETEEKVVQETIENALEAYFKTTK